MNGVEQETTSQLFISTTAFFGMTLTPHFRLHPTEGNMLHRYSIYGCDLSSRAFSDNINDTGVPPAVR